RDAAGQPPPGGRGRVAEDRGRTDLPAVATARGPGTRHARSDHGLPDRHLPGRPRVPAGTPAGREGARAAEGRQRLQLHPEDPPGPEHAALRPGYTHAPDAAHHPDEPGAGVRGTSGPVPICVDALPARRLIDGPIEWEGGARRAPPFPCRHAAELVLILFSRTS